MSYTPEERKARRKANNHRRYLQRKIVGYYANKHEPVTGTMGAVEAPDMIESVAPNLREKYMLALLTRDAKIWRKHRQANDHALAPEDALSPLEASKTTTHTGRKATPGEMSEAEKQKRRAAWTPERREAQRRQTAEDGSKGGTGRHVAGPGRPTSSARAAAKAAGKTTYMRDEPCKHCGGHVYLVSNWSCVGCRKSGTVSAARASLPRLSQYRTPLGASQRSVSTRAPHRVTATRGM